jgi:hypothetical protein
VAKTDLHFIEQEQEPAKAMITCPKCGAERASTFLAFACCNQKIKGEEVHGRRK